MPDLDDLEVARQMRSIDPSVPLILFTLVDVWGLESAAQKAGIARVVSKAESWKLMKSIEEVVGDRESSRRKST